MKPCKVELDSVGLVYRFNLRDKLTFILGLSGTGKTLLVRVIYGVRLGTTTLRSDYASDIIDITDMRANEITKLYNDTTGCIFVIDEVALADIDVISDFLYKSDNLFIIISRDNSTIFQNIRSFTAISEMCNIVKTEDTTVNSIRSIYESGEPFTFNDNETGIIVEDKGNVYSILSGKYNHVRSSKGNSRVGKNIKLYDDEGIDDILVIGDSSNIGLNFTNTEFMARHTKARVKYLYLHSGEQLLLPAVSREYIDISYNPSNYIDLNKFNSYEDFYLDYINSVFTKTYGTDYHKNLCDITYYFPNINIITEFIDKLIYYPNSNNLFESFANSMGVSSDFYEHIIFYRDYSNKDITGRHYSDEVNDLIIKHEFYEWIKLCTILDEDISISVKEDGSFMIESDTIVFVKSGNFVRSIDCDYKMIKSLLLLYYNGDINLQPIG